MTKEEYKSRRKALLDEAQALIDAGKLEDFEAKKGEIEQLDSDYEAKAVEAANFRAMTEDPAVIDVFGTGVGGVIGSMGFDNINDEKGIHAMKNKNEVKAFQNFIASGGDMRTMPENLRNAITTTQAGAVLPTDIFSKLITGEKYSDLLHRATVITQDGAGVIKIPIASNNAATWKTEGAAVTPSNPTMTSIDLGGVELLRAIQYSAAVDSLSVENFADLMAGLVSSETVETLEKAFGSGSVDGGQPHNGLDNLTWTANTNLIEATGAITAADVAKALSLLPQKYARNVILLMNANTAYNAVGLFKGTNEYAYNIADGASRFMGREIVISEHCGDNVIYIVDPQQLYVRFAMPPTVEVDRSSGFLSATTAIRCLAVVDYAWNPAACVKVAVAAAGK